MALETHVDAREHFMELMPKIFGMDGFQKCVAYQHMVNVSLGMGVNPEATNLAFLLHHGASEHLADLTVDSKSWNALGGGGGGCFGGLARWN